GGATGGRREFAPTLARAAAGAGVDGFFVETHPDPRLALSDGPNMIPLVDLEELLAGVVAVWEAARAHTGNGDR
ncbi:MAG TPA: 3-deoxy-8-phosphooctulonate synthase, partial [Bacteroidetes bacterium]|nr:3-deoxy-8-phosphooctulonate synthase [Bacteroidota bacterium]